MSRAVRQQLWLASTSTTASRAAPQRCPDLPRTSFACSLHCVSTIVRMIPRYQLYEPGSRPFRSAATGTAGYRGPRAGRDRDGLLLPAAGWHQRGRACPGTRPDGARPRGHRRHGAPPAPPRGRRRSAPAARRRLRDHPHRRGDPALRQRLGDAAHDPAAADRDAPPPVPRAGASTSCTCTRPTTRACA